MKDALAQRLEALRAEHQKGQEHLAALRQQHAEIQATVLRIEGAISVLQDVLASEAPGGRDGAGDSP